MAHPYTSESLKDPEAFRTLYNHYYSGLVVYAKEYMLTNIEAEDLVQDIFVTLWEKQNKLIINNIKTYLFRATQNSCLNYLSHMKVRTKYQNVILNERKPINALDEDFYVEFDLERLIIEAIAQLPPQRQKVFTMNRFEGRTIQEISEHLGISPRTVEKHLQLTLAELRENLADYITLMAVLLYRLL